MDAFAGCIVPQGTTELHGYPRIPQSAAVLVLAHRNTLEGPRSLSGFLEMRPNVTSRLRGCLLGVYGEPLRTRLQGGPMDFLSKLVLLFRFGVPCHKRESTEELDEKCLEQAR